MCATWYTPAMSEDVHAEDAGPEGGQPLIMHRLTKMSERFFESDKSANVVIVVFVLLSILPLLGIGILLTRATAPTPLEQSSR